MCVRRKGQIKFCKGGMVFWPTLHLLWRSSLVLVPDSPWLSDQRPHLRISGGHRRLEQTKNHCTKTHVVKSLLALAFMASETTLDQRVRAVYFLSLFFFSLSFSSTNFLFLKSGCFKVGCVRVC